MGNDELCNELIDYVIDIYNHNTVITGISDITLNSYNVYYMKDFYYTIITGKDDEDFINETLKESECDVDREGEYEFQAILKYDSGQYDSYGRCESRPYLYVDYIRFNFIQTFTARDRDQKLNELGISDLDIFN